MLPPFSAVTAPLAPAQAVLGIVMGVLLLGYGSLWVRYLVRGREPELLYGRWGGVPVPLAVLPVLAVAACAGWSGSPWILAAAAILAAGHVPISLRIARSLRNTPRDIPHQREAE